LEAGHDHDLADRLYKEMLDIKNYGWKSNMKELVLKNV